MKQTKEQEKCEECKYCKSVNPRHPICNYHQGAEQGKAQAIKQVLEIIEPTITKWHTYLSALNAQGTLDYPNTIAVLEHLEGELKASLEKL